MGNNSSKIKKDKEVGKTPPPKIRSNTYFGGNGQIGDIDDEHIEETLRDLNLERLYQQAPQLRPADPSQQPPREQLKTMISISDPNPYIKIIGSVHLLVFGLKLQAPSRIIIIANNLINSLSVDVCDRTTIGIPIPAFSDFVVEILPDLEHSTTLIKEGFTQVIKHTFEFKLVDLNESFKYTYLGQKLFVTDYRFYQMIVNKYCDQVNEENQNICLCCLKNAADTAVSSCGHNVICSDCKSKYQIQYCNCPICNQKSTI